MQRKALRNVHGIPIGSLKELRQLGLSHIGDYANDCLR